MLRKIDCVLLRVENLEAAVAYYQDVFGLRLKWRNGLQVGLGLPETETEIVLESGPDMPAGASVHYLVDDVRAAVDYLVGRGCGVLVAPFEITIGCCAVVTDPFGNTLSLLDMTKGPLPQGLGLSSEPEPPLGTPTPPLDPPNG
jgi:predicted enzyme related to lactoylglutathione lyase